ncbi:Uncharacterized protein APZ42_032445, partial [Daphnia magna]
TNSLCSLQVSWLRSLLQPLQTTTNSLYPACSFFASTRQPPISTLCCLRFTILHRLPSFCTHETTTNFQGYVGCVPFCSHQTTNNSLFSTAPFTALQLPLDSLQ